MRARRDRDEALHQLELLSSHYGGRSGAALAAAGGGRDLHGAVGAAAAQAMGLPSAAAVEVREGASDVERECAGAIADMALYRTALERRKKHTRAAAARAVPFAGLSTNRAAGAGGGGGAVATADQQALDNLRATVVGALGGMSELLASAVELCETQHPDLWQGTAEQLMLSDQIRQSQRLVHLLGKMQEEFGGVVPIR